MEQNNTEIVICNSNNLTNPIHIVRPKQELVKYIEWDIIKTKLNAINDPKVKILIMTLAYTGLRVSEVINIQKQDINFNDGFMEVKHLKSRKYERRIIPIRQELNMALLMSSQYLKLPDRVFPYTRQYVHQLTMKYFDTNPHSFRHSFAVHFLRTSKNPLSLEILRQLLGHSNINTTMEYLKIVPMQVKKALDDVTF